MISIFIPNLKGEINDNKNFDRIEQIDGESNKVIFDSNERSDNNNYSNSSEQTNDVDIDIENVKNFQAKYQGNFNISDTSKDTENKWDVLLELSNNTTPAWKKGTTLIVGDSILSGLKESNMLQKELIKVRTYPGVTIEQMKFFVVLHVEKKPDTIIIHVRTNNAPHSSSYEMVHEIQSLGNFILKYLPSARITILTLVLLVNKAKTNDINKAFTELVKESTIDYISNEKIKGDYISHENIKESYIDEYGLHINRDGFSVLT